MSFLERLFGKKRKVKVNDSNADTIIDAYSITLRNLSSTNIMTTEDLPYSKETIREALDWKMLEIETTIDAYKMSGYKSKMFDDAAKDLEKEMDLYIMSKMYLDAFYDLSDEDKQVVAFINECPNLRECRRILSDPNESEERKSTCRYVLEQWILLMKKYNPSASIPISEEDIRP